MKEIMSYDEYIEEAEGREEQRDEGVTAAVTEIIADVKSRGDAALREYTKRFDGCELETIMVTEEEQERALREVGKEFRGLMERAAANIAEYHARQKGTGFVITRADGVTLGQRVIPLRRVGLYIPGGTAAYPSSVLMNSIPAKLAGVGEIVITTPPNKKGSISDAILAAARIAGVDKIYKVGGAQAVAALAYGTETIKRVDKITGPGNDYVAEAKRQVYGAVGIDMIAGPSDILIIADKTADPVYCAADMLAQCEHGETSRAILITDNRMLAEEVAVELERQLVRLPRERTARAALDNNGRIIITESIEQGFKLSNEIAPEHLEIMTENPIEYLGLAENAGSVFLGKNTPEALGDYYAGTNHTIPTSGTARFSSPLSVDDFVKKSSFTYYPSKALADAADDIIKFAEKEGLHAHGESVRVRKNKENGSR